MINWIWSFFNLVFPSYCVVCNHKMNSLKESVCVKCLCNLPVTTYHLSKDNEIEKYFWGIFPIERATAYFYFAKGSDFQNILYRIKYYGNQQLARKMGRDAANYLLSANFFDGIDLIIPVPLHKSKEKKRGYNQSEWIAKGISEITGIEVSVNLLSRIKLTSTQTRKNIWERWENMESAFVLDDNKSLAGKHILLVDDVLTTGATICACAMAFDKIKKIKISVFTLAIASAY